MVIELVRKLKFRDMTQKGMGVMLGILGGNQETVNTVKSSLNKTIEKVWLDKEADTLNFKFTDGTDHC